MKNLVLVAVVVLLVNMEMEVTFVSENQYKIQVQ